MSENLRELNTPSVGWLPISLDFGRDEALCAIEDESVILAAAGLHVAGMAACLAKDDDWLSRNEVFRVVIPGTRENKTAAAEALCSVGLWTPEQRGGSEGWRLGVSSVLAEKRKRIANATNAANARYKAQREKEISSPSNNQRKEEDNPF